MLKNAKIYVAGHLGLVGSAIVRNLKNSGYTNLILKTHKELDLTIQLDVNNFFRQIKPDYVFVAAARVGGIFANNTFRADFLYENLQIQNNIIHASFKSKVKKLIFLGSSCIYPGNARQPIKEEYLLEGKLEYTNEPYAIAKIAGIKLCESYNVQYGTNYLSVMPTNLYGPNDNFDLEKSHVLPAIIRKCYLAKLLNDSDYGKIADNIGLIDDNQIIINSLTKYGIYKLNNQVTLKLWGSGRPYREFMYVDDLASATIFIMNNIDFKDIIKDQKEIRNSHINIGTGTDITIKSLAQIIKEEMQFTGSIEFDQNMPDGTMKKLLNVDKLNQLGWRHQTELRNGIRQTINWYMESLK